ncbi:AMP-binding protein [Lachnospira sp.]|jgi:fatty-acyl-CoA synthase|uniref:AMP-binding protein n=1 Tax=Lachnospira sp. TaxID=2049031 RepID=UPI002579DFB6|nr:AMP-binding protein [Lachnospira sp.]
MEFVTENDVIDLLKRNFPDLEKIPVSKSFTQSGILSSLDLVNLVFELENEFNVEFDLENIDLTEFDSPLKIAETINKLKGSDNNTIRKLIDSICSEKKDEIALIFDDYKITYGELYKNIKTLSFGFIKDGVNKGTHVAIILENCMEYIMSYFSLFYIGAIPIPINTRWNTNEAIRVIKDSDSCYFISKEHQGKLKFKDIYNALVEDNIKINKVYYCQENLDEEIKEIKKFSDIYSDKEEKLNNITGEDIAMISYTSGTTGVPKGVVLKNNSVTNISLYTAKVWTDCEDSPFSIAPLYSAQGFLSMLIDFSVGSKFKMISSFNTNDILQEISKGENTIFHTQPTMWTMLLNSRAINFARFTGLRKIVVSGSLCSPELAKRIEKRLGLRLLNAYGLIEGTSVATMTRYDDSEEIRYNTVGRPIPGVSIRIVDKNHKPVEHGQIGELAIKGYVMDGYYKNPEKTKEVIDDEGWLYTGDLARYYDDENISIVGRCKDMVIRGGFNVYPSDIEEVILQIPEVQTTAVVGKEHEVLGEELIAFVVLRPGENIRENDIRKYVFKNLANYKQPDKFYLISDMPTILAGKIDKKVLKKWAVSGIPDNKKMLFA